MQNKKKVKYFFYKFKKGKLKKFKKSCLNFGLLGLKALESGIITNKQIDSFKQFMFKKTYKKVKVWVKVFPCFYVTKKSIGFRMGKGKGKLYHKIYSVVNGSILFEICGSKMITVINAIKLSKLKLPVKTKLVK